MKYTLFATSITRAETEDHRTSELNDFGSLLKAATAASIKIGEGIFLFQTQRDYADILHLREVLRSRLKEYIELPISEEIHGGFSPTVAQRLTEEAGLAVHNAIRRSTPQ